MQLNFLQFIVCMLYVFVAEMYVWIEIGFGQLIYAKYSTIAAREKEINGGRYISMLSAIRWRPTTIGARSGKRVQIKKNNEAPHVNWELIIGMAFSCDWNCADCVCTNEVWQFKSSHKMRVDSGEHFFRLKISSRCLRWKKENREKSHEILLLVRINQLYY